MGPPGQDPQRDNDLLYRLRGLPMGGAVLHLGAHPDDEDSGVVAYLSRGLGVRTVYWSATRGEGGQNRIGPERDEALGILRTWESLDARQVDGAEVLYGPFIDFGFSKSGEDTLERWGREDAVREIVRAIRLIQPQVVLSRWSGGAEDGHGQHQAVGLAAPEAFRAAGDPDRFPELSAQGLPPWRPRKLYHSMVGDWQAGQDVEFGVRMEELEGPGFVRVNTGIVDPIGGRTYQELAALAANRHRSQAMAFLPERGDYFYYFRLVDGAVASREREETFFDGLDPTLPGIADDLGAGPTAILAILREARHHAEAATSAFRPDNRRRAGEEILQGIARLEEAGRIAAGEDLSEDVRLGLDAYLGRKVRAFEDVAARCLGLSLECLLDQSRVTPGQRVSVTARLWNEDAQPSGASELRVHVPDGWISPVIDEPEDVGDVESAQVRRWRVDLAVPVDAPLTTPYWLRARRGPWAYAWPPTGPLSSPLDEPPVWASCEVQVGEHRMTLRAPGAHRETFSGGFRELPLSVLPAIALQPSERRVLLPPHRPERLSLHLSARCMRPEGASGTLHLEAPDDWGIHPAEVELAFEEGGQSTTLTFEVSIPATVAPGVYPVGYRAVSAGRTYGEALDPVRQPAPGLPGPANEATCISEAFLMPPAAVSVHLLDAEFVRTLRYGYIPGVQEGIVDVLSRFDVDVTVLTEQELSYADLDTFDTVIVGPHAYLQRPDLRKNAARLLTYVERGGNLVVQVQGFGYDAGGLAPYPFRFSNPHDRVANPEAPVRILAPEHPVMNVPNRIGPPDFEGWVHERGLYFFGAWDRRYTPILAATDPGEDPKEGGLMVATHGRGTYIYTGYSFFRQVPAGVDGALRLFANLVGLAEARIIERRERARTIPLFASLTDAQLYEVARLMSERWLDKEAYLARQGDRGDELYLILEGEVDVVKEDGEPRIVTVAREGEAIGELAVLTEQPRTASLRARSDLKVLSMRAGSFRELLRQNPDVAEGVLRLLANRLVRREEETRTSTSG